MVGIGASGWESLGARERQLVTSADHVFGSTRQLELLPAVPGQGRTSWPSPLRPALAGLLADHDHLRLVVVASGDPLLAGIGTTLIDIFGTAAVRVHPGVSSVALARARMGWAAETVDLVRLNDPTADPVRRYLSPNRRLVVLSRDGDSPSTVVEVLRETGFGRSDVVVLSDLGSDQELRIDATAGDWHDRRFPDLNVVCVTCRADRTTGVWSNAPGLPDDAFEHDGQLTKRDVRAAALASLMPVPGQLLWDVGAGAGSVGIEWMRIHPACRAVAVERDPVRAERISRNAARLGVSELEVVEGAAPQALTGLQPPDAVFVGGGASHETLDLAWHGLAAGGRLVVHAVTLETEMLVTECWRRLGGQLSRISIELMQPIGSYSGWKPARPVVQWSVQKPLGPDEGAS